MARDKGGILEVGATVISYTPGVAARVAAAPAVQPVAPADPAASVEVALRRLAKMRDEGLVDDGEYAAKKAELLSRL